MKSVSWIEVLDYIYISNILDLIEFSINLAYDCIQSNWRDLNDTRNITIILCNIILAAL